MIFVVFFSGTLFGEIAAETKRRNEKINVSMSLKKHSIWVRWKDITSEQLMTFHGVMLNMARHVQCSIKDFS
jgi:hypothetical protein